MARMIPDYIHRDCKSNAERKLFERFRNELAKSYVVLHSLGLAKHKYKLRAEIDFVVVCQKGILCFEVKGGRIKQEKGKWHFINKYDEVTIKSESPFEQASTAMFALRKKIGEKFGWNSPHRRSIMGYCAIFPDQLFSLESPEWDLKRLFDKTQIGGDLQKLVDWQYDYSAEEIYRTTGNRCVTLESAQVKSLLHYLRPDFEIIPPLSSKINEDHDKLLKLTEEQYDVLDQIGINDRIIVTGSAGTGKTLLAVEKFKREVQNGKKVIYLCYNKLLARHIRKLLNENLEGGVEVHTLHGYTRKLIGLAGLNASHPDENDSSFFTEKYPDLFEQAFVELFDSPPFDILIIDEGQDLNTESYIGMLDWLVQDGMKDGRWIWFEDNQQNIFKQDSDTVKQPVLKKYHPARFCLTSNCRNTKPISVFNSLATATEKQKCLVDSNLKVSPVFYTSNNHQRKKLEDIITRLLGGGVDPLDIVLLSPHIQAKSVLQGVEKIGGIPVKVYETHPNAAEKVLRFATIHKFKGLEAKIIIVTDVTELDSVNMRSLNYVAFSRPSACLEVLLHEDTRKQFEQLAYQFGMRDI